MKRILTFPHGLTTTFSQIKAKPFTPPHSPNGASEKDEWRKCSYKSSWERRRKDWSKEKGFNTKSNYDLKYYTVKWKYTLKFYVLLVYGRGQEWYNLLKMIEVPCMHNTRDGKIKYYYMFFCVDCKISYTYS